MTVYSLGADTPEFPGDGDCWIAPGAHVIGKVVLGKSVSVWFGAVLRGDNEPLTLGDGTNIQDNAVLHTDPGFPLVIGSDCTIGHAAVVHGCRIGSGSLVGMSATVLNGAVIGRDCLIGAGALVTEGAQVPDGSLVLGVPGRVVRRLQAHELSDIAAAAKHYRERCAKYRAVLRPAS